MLSALKTKRARVGLVALALLAFTGAAVAYFTATGSGSGTSSAGTSSAMTIHATINTPTGGLVPGGSAPVSFTVDNPGGNQQVGTVTLSSVTAYTDSSQTTAVPGCLSGWFSMIPVSEGQDVPNGNGTPLTTGGTLQFNDSSTTNQDACKGKFLVASFSSN